MIHLSQVLPLIDKLVGSMNAKEAVHFKTALLIKSVT